MGTVRNLRVLKMRGISWLTAEPVSFSRGALLHGVSKYYVTYLVINDCLCVILISDQPRGLVVRASGYKSRGPGFDSRLFHGDFPCGGMIPVVTMFWVVSRIRFKVETSLTRSHNSINSWVNPRQRSPRWRGPHHERQPAHQLIEYLVLWLLITEEE